MRTGERDGSERGQRLDSHAFVTAWADVEGTHELVDGVVVTLGPATLRHARINTNLVVVVHQLARTFCCMAYGTNLWCELGEWDVRAPDLALYCDPRDLADPALDDRLTLCHPYALVAVNARREADDLERRLALYRSCPTVQTIATLELRDVAATLEERAADGGWITRRLAPGDDLEFGMPGLRLPLAAIYE